MITIPRSSINILQLYKDGQDKASEEHAEGEDAKLGTLRGGHTGAIVDGQVIGKCHRTAHLRSLGIQEATGHSDKLMFEAGFANEDIWVGILGRVWKGKILCEEEIPTHWLTDSQMPVTGRPDIVLCSESGDPTLGIELKLVSSPWSAYNKAVKDIPDPEHILQAAHYMWQLNIPYKLCYTSRANYSVGFTGMAANWKRKASHLLNEDQYKAIPFILEVDLWVENGIVKYEMNGEVVTTPITIDGIKEYYERVSQMGERKSLGPRPVGMYANGTIKEQGKHQCDYCPFKSICDTYEADYDRWVDEIKRKLLTEDI